MEKKFYTRKEAAEILRCEPQTISNLALRGLINITKSGNIALVEKESFDNYVDRLIPATKTLSQIDGLIQSIINEQEQYKKEYNRMHTERWFVNNLDIRYVTEVLEEICKFIKVGTPLKSVESDTILSFLRGWNLSRIAEEQGKTKEAIKMAFVRGTKKMKTYLATFPAIIEANNRHKRRIAELEEIIAKKDEEMQIMKLKLGIKFARKNKIKDPKLMGMDRMVALLNRKVEDISVFSIRAIHGFHSADIITVGDLVSYSREDILNLRNIGLKTITEIDSFLNGTGLKFGMNLNSYKAFLVHPTTTK